MAVTQAVILCGGKGTRLGELARAIPKPLVPAGGVPVIEHLMRCLAKAGVTRFVLAAGHLGEVIAEAYATSPIPGCTIETIIEREPLGTAGVFRSLERLLDDDFVVAYGDIFVDFDATGLLRAHERKLPAATLLARCSDHPWDSHLLQTNADGVVTEFVHRREPERLYRNLANAGIYVLSKLVLRHIPAGRASDFGGEIFPALIANGETVRAHLLEADGFVKDMGTPVRLREVEAYLHERELAARARRSRSLIRTVFLDRDGVLNEDVGLLSLPENLALAEGAAEAVALLNSLGIRCVVTTNQSVIARGLCDEAGLARIHERLRSELAANGGKLEAIYHCPHHPETHHAEGVPELRRGCRCRKPAPGMIFRAVEELAIDLSSAIMVGDRATDVLAGRAAGVSTVLVGDAGKRSKEREIAAADGEFDSLLAFARALSERRDLFA